MEVSHDQGIAVQFRRWMKPDWDNPELLDPEIALCPLCRRLMLQVSRTLVRRPRTFYCTPLRYLLCCLGQCIAGRPKDTGH